MREILAVIPARSGSKSISNKNIRLINNKPMLAYSIMHAQKSKYITRIVLSTDSEMYAQIGEKYGAEVPFIRPAEYASDSAFDIDVFYHALNYLKNTENYVPCAVVHLRPTYPVRNIEDIDNMIKIILENEKVDSVRSISPANEIPFKMWTMNEKGMLSPICKDIPECFNMPRQNLPQAYYQNACIDVIKSSVILEQKSMSGENIQGYLMENNFDIDTEEDFKIAEEILLTLEGKKKFCFDIDGVIAVTKDIKDYSKSRPDFDIINMINKLHSYGNNITLFTARGYETGKDWQKLTREQMCGWGVEYDELKFGKPAADYYVDDHAMSLNGLKKLEKLLGLK